MDTKTCTGCGQTKTTSEFGARRENGSVRLKSHCRACNRAARRSHYVENKASYIEKAGKRNIEQRERIRVEILNYLRDNPCVDCGEADPVVLQFDHRDRAAKNFQIADVLSKGYSVKRVLAEIDLCDVRCANCHARKTAREGGFYLYRMTRESPAAELS